MTVLSSFIDGNYSSADKAETFTTTNPATGEVLATIAQAGQSVVDDAVNSAIKGQRIWASLPPVERGRILLKAAQILRDRNDELALLEVRDTGKPLQEANIVDIMSGADVIEYYAGLADKIQGEYQQLSTSQSYHTRREPLGVCAGIGAWNYPIQIACWKSAPALAAGNAMIFKPSEETPLTALKLAEIYKEAGLPDGVFNVVQGDYRVGQMLTAHPDIAKISFTGESGTGKTVMADSSQSLKQVTMELGGKSPLIIFDDFPIEQAITGAMLANFYTQGEVCTHGTRVYVHSNIYNEFLERLKERTEALIIGNPEDPETQIGALISQDHLQKVMGYIDQGKKTGARLVCGGHRMTTGGLDKGNFVAPTIFADCNENMSIVNEEIFGPVMCVMPFDNEDKVVECANDTAYGLAAGIFTKDISRAHRVINQMKAGICWINTWGNSPAEMPVGGYKQSGIGRENGLKTLHHYTQLKSVFVELDDLPESY